MSDYIKREDAIRVICNDCGNKEANCGCAEIEELKAIPAADVVEVVRCKDCVYKGKAFKNLVSCVAHAIPMHDYDFCSVGERKK